MTAEYGGIGGVFGLLIVVAVIYLAANWRTFLPRRARRRT